MCRCFYSRNQGCMWLRTRFAHQRNYDTIKCYYIKVVDHTTVSHSLSAVMAPKTHLAVLIGVGSHVEGQCTTPVRGALADIEAISTILDPRPHVQVTKFGIGADGTIVGQLPTRADIRRFFDSLIDVVNGPGSTITHVYIHFSGHGTRRQGCGPALLVLYDLNIGTKDLAKWIAKLNEHNIRVTLVLDCCFSASAHRGDDDSDIRFTEYNPEFDCDPDGVLQNQDSFMNAVEDGSRGTSLRFPIEDAILHKTRDRYAIFTACDSNEIAKEIDITVNKSVQKRGALSYFLTCALEDLAKEKTRIAYRSLHRHLKSLVRSSCPQQTPMLYGNLQDPFFDELVSGFGLPFVSLHWKDGDIILDAGQASGVHVGDEYEAFPFHFTETAGGMAREQSIRLRVKEVDGCTSRLCNVDQAKSLTMQVATTWKARLVISCSQDKTPVRMLPSLPEADRAALLQEEASYPFLRLVNSQDVSSPHVFNLGMDPTTEHYKICDVSDREVPYVPKIQRGDNNALQSLARILGHLAKFKFFETIRNPKPDHAFESSFEVTPSQLCAKDGWYEVENGGEWRVKCTNKGSSTLYLSIICFRTCWEILNMTSVEGDDELYPLQARDQQECSKDVEFESQLSDEDGDMDEEVFKFFITDKPTAFEGMMLPPLAEIFSGKGCDDDQSAGSALFDDHEKWAVKTFRIRTVR
ncbi:hypothetical protein QBC41DRAFT_157328 [Cercophora samala]|uniref:Peptidase C14 caspase domain-containing protein n=1 Tax=Cercophora samala TaxID=330535 RepID=A0AA39Z8D4_9PEZI|nr:hypothetical protein QBC41DRAFT_157328 [Cercophora samala]